MPRNSLDHEGVEARDSVTRGINSVGWDLTKGEKLKSLFRV